MTVRGAYRVEGAAQLRQTLKAAGDDLGDLKAVHREVGAIVAAEAKAKAPSRSGRLRATVRASSSTSRASIRAGNKTNVRYALPTHWGWKSRGQRANPWVSHAAQRTESRWLDVYEQAVKVIVEKVKGA